MPRASNLILFIALAFASTSAFAARVSSSGSGASGISTLNGSSSIGLFAGIVNSAQDSLNDMQQRANTREGGITTSQLTQAWEVAGHITYRYSGTIWAIQIRPSYFYERADGHGTSGSFTYGVTGWTVFPILKMYPLENDFMKFYMQAGLGYGQVTAFVNEGQDASGHNRHVDFGSGAFGSTVGLGAEFAYSPSHAFSLECNYRYLNFQRNIVTSSSGSFASGSLTQYGKGQEVELDSNDLAVKMGGLQFLAGYSYYF